MPSNLSASLFRLMNQIWTIFNVSKPGCIFPNLGAAEMRPNLDRSCNYPSEPECAVFYPAKNFSSK